MRRFLLVLVSTIFVASCANTTSSKPTITVGSGNFTESIVLGQIYAQGLESKGYNVATKLNIGARDIYWKAMENGSVDLLPEYTGALLRFVTKNDKAGSPDPKKTFDALKRALTRKRIIALRPAPGQDKDGIVTNKTTADRYNLKKVSDLTPVAPQLVMGGPPECPTRPSCLKGLEDVYGMHFKEFRPLDPSGPVTVTLLDNNTIQVANLFTTDGRIAQKGFVLLDDNKGIEVAQSIIAVVRQPIVKAYGTDLRTYLNDVDAKLTTAVLTDLNKQVDIDHKDADAVAKAWLEENGLYGKRT